MSRQQPKSAVASMRPDEMEEPRRKRASKRPPARRKKRKRSKSKGRVASKRRSACAAMRPDEMAGDFDLLATLTDAKPDTYRGDALITLSGVPGYFRTSLRRVLRDLEGPERFGQGQVLGACIRRGVRVVLTSRAGERSVRLSEEFYDAELPADLAVFVDQHVIHGGGFSVPDHHTKRERLVFRTNPAIRSELAGIAEKLGITAAALGAVALAIGFQDQPGVLADHGRFMADAIEQLLTFLDTRSDRLEAILGMSP